MKALYLIIAAVILAAVQLPDSAAFNMRLTVSGSGYVTSGSPSFITCDGICNAIYVPPGAEITLTATPYGNSQFAGWGGACSGTEQYRPGQQFDLTPSGGSRNNAYVIGEAVSSLSYCAKSGHEMREAEHAPFCCSGQVDRNKKCT